MSPCCQWAHWASKAWSRWDLNLVWTHNKDWRGILGAQYSLRETVGPTCGSKTENEGVSDLRMLKIKFQITKTFPFICRVGDVLNRLHVAQPKPRDHKAREASIPESVIAARQSMEVVDHSSNTGKKKTKPQVDSDEELIWYKDEPSDEDEEEKNPTNFGVDWRSKFPQKVITEQDSGALTVTLQRIISWRMKIGSSIPSLRLWTERTLLTLSTPTFLQCWTDWRWAIIGYWNIRVSCVCLRSVSYRLEPWQADEEQRLAAADLAENDDNEVLICSNG